MSDLRPNGVKIAVAGQEYELLFTINVIDEIQASCNMALFDVIGMIAGAAAGETDHETLKVYRSVLTALLNRNAREQLTEVQVGDAVEWKEYQMIATAMLRAYGISMPENEDDEQEDDEGSDPNVETGR